MVAYVHIQMALLYVPVLQAFKGQLANKLDPTSVQIFHVKTVARA